MATTTRSKIVENSTMTNEPALGPASASASVSELGTVALRVILVRLIGVVVLVLSLSVQSFAQQGTSGLDGQREKSTRAGPRKQLATIIFAGLGGAVLGLSTLSFYGRPQDRLSNIAIGFAIGVISGTVYVTYNAATNPHEFYADRPWLEQERLMLGARDTGLTPSNWARMPAPPKTLNVGITF
jgi:hypothetical protein